VPEVVTPPPPLPAAPEPAPVPEPAPAAPVAPEQPDDGSMEFAPR